MTRLAIRMPKMSMTMTEGEVSTWFAKVGDTVAEGDVVCEVMTDKVDMEVESSVSGTLVEIAVESGMVDVGEPIGWVEGEDTGGGFGDLLSEPDADPEPVPDTDPEPEPDPPADPPADEAPVEVLPVEESDPGTVDKPPSAEQPQPVEQPAEQPVDTAAEAEAPSGPVAAVPRARGLARERGIDLAGLTGSGPDGLILLGDVEGAGRAAAPAAREQAAPAASAPAASRSQTSDRSSVRPSGQPGGRRAAIRGAVARKMTPSALIPQFTVWREIHLDAADTQRRGLSWTTVLIRAYAAALREVPELLSRWEDEAPSESGPPSIALAVATDRGLLVPTFAEPDRPPANDVDAEIRAVVKSAHTGKLDPAYMGIANGSLSNLGGMGVDRFQALLTPPQGSVLSLGSIRQRPVAVPGGVGLALTVEAGLTVDHRVADGAHAAELLERFARRLGGSL